jgi:hypothetical protein
VPIPPFSSSQSAVSKGIKPDLTEKSAFIGEICGYKKGRKIKVNKTKR